MRNNIRLTALAVNLFFFIWILPLGVFIRPSQEKLACGGQRAICLCSHMQEQANSKPLQSSRIQSNDGSNEEGNTSGTNPGSYYLTVEPVLQNALSSFAFNDHSSLSYLNTFLKSIEHVPKTPILF